MMTKVRAMASGTSVLRPTTRDRGRVKGSSVYRTRSLYWVWFRIATQLHYWPGTV